MAANQYTKKTLLVFMLAATYFLLPSCANKQPKPYKYKKPKKEKIMRDDTRDLMKHLKK